MTLDTLQQLLDKIQGAETDAVVRRGKFCCPYLVLFFLGGALCLWIMDSALIVGCVPTADYKQRPL